MKPKCCICGKEVLGVYYPDMKCYCSKECMDKEYGNGN